ncbi:MAG: hypothetical protein U1E87_05760 [Alphaproteobacteria bacterium]
MPKLKLTRRSVLLGGGGLLTAALGLRAGLTGAVVPSLGAAYEPWRDVSKHPPGSAEALVAHAILAASPHNTQPWHFYRAADGLGLSADLTRNLGTFDPYLREMHVGIGAAVENLSLAAASQRRIVRVRHDTRDLAAFTPRTGRGPLIALDISEGDAIPDQLVKQIPKRHTNRGPYKIGEEARHLLADALREAAIDQSLCRFVMIEDEVRAKQFDSLVVEATQRIIDDAEMVRDSDRWFRTQSQIPKSRDGLTLDAAGLAPPVAFLAKMLPPMSAQSNHENWLRLTRATLATTPVRGFVLVPELYDLGACIAAGRAWQRFHLAATARGLALQPVNQPIEIMEREAVRGQRRRWRAASRH